MSDTAKQWQYLGAGEKTTCEEYTFLVRLQDWKGYDAAQTQRRQDAWHWLKDRLDCYAKPGSDCSTWSHAKDRADYIDAVLHGYDVLHYAQATYPRDWMPSSSDKDPGHDDQNVYVKERCYWLSFQTQYDAQKDRKLANLNRLQTMRQDTWRYADANGWDADHRTQRYQNLQIATHYGSAWADWKAGKYKYPDPDPAFHKSDSGGGGSSWRDKSAKWHDSHLGITESPPNSNCDTRSDGIRNAQDTCANGTWLRNQPWCGVWCFMGLYQSGKVKSGNDSWMASVASIEDYAKAAKGPFKGWTTDGSKAKKGDLVVLFGRGQHVGTVRSIDSSYAYTWEGNTSSGSGGSQSNGGGSYKRSRSRSSETYGYALVRD
jgi:hypothetical protein